MTKKEAKEILEKEGILFDVHFLSYSDSLLEITGGIYTDVLTARRIATALNTLFN